MLSRNPFQWWKVLPVSKGLSTLIPALNSWRRNHARTGGTDTPRYCYSVWLRHLVLLDRCGFKIAGTRVGELGPGDSIGIGLAALLSGAIKYVGLDIVPFSAKADLENIFQDLVQLYTNRERIPDSEEFPRIQPRLESYEFPDHLIDWHSFSYRAANIRMELRTKFERGHFVEYRAPWASLSEISADSLDLIFSQAVLEHIDDLEETYQAMSLWLKPGGYASHVVDFTAHGLSPFWNGHWAYSDFEWRLVRGRREYLLNREPLSTHLACARHVGLQVTALTTQSDSNGLNQQRLSQRFQNRDTADLRTRGAIIILRKPARATEL